MIKPSHAIYLLGLSLLPCSTVFAGASPLEFSAEEIAANLSNAKLISESAAACLTRTWDEHNKFFKQRGYSKFYGNRHPKHKFAAGRKATILQLIPKLENKVILNDQEALRELEQREEELKATSCIGLTMECLGEGFNKAGMTQTWDKIRLWVGRKDAEGTLLFYGTDLQKALVDLGWRSLYWNPDVAQSEEWDVIDKLMNPLKEGKEWNPIWGGHSYRFKVLKNTREYYGIPVHDIQTLVNFGIKTPEEFKQAPFFIGTAHAGYHVFPGFHGQVIEAHSMRELNSISNLEIGPFNPIFQALNGVKKGNGAPKWTNSEHYKSGVIVVPPGFISEKPFLVPPGAPENTPRSPMPEGERTPNHEEDSESWEPIRRRPDRFLPPWLR